MLSINITQAKQKGIVENDLQLSSDTLEQVNQLFDLIRKKYKVEILLQSDVELDIKTKKWICIIGRRLTDFEGAQSFGNGIGDTIGEAMIDSINKFIEYFGIHRNYLTGNMNG